MKTRGLFTHDFKTSIKKFRRLNSSSTRVKYLIKSQHFCFQQNSCDSSVMSRWDPDGNKN